MYRKRRRTGRKRRYSRYSRYRRWYTNGYLKASFALITLIILLALTAVVTWRMEEHGEKERISEARELAMSDYVLSREAEQTAIRQETTLYEETLPVEPSGELPVPAPQTGVVVYEEPEPEAEQDAVEAEPEQDADAGEEGESETEVPAPPQRTGRVIFVGDSRTIDMFADSNDPVEGAVHDGITVYARHARGFDYLESTVNSLALTADDTLVTWMGANDRGNFSSYQTLYTRLLTQGTGLVLCTVGPTTDGNLQYWDLPYYTNDKMQYFNQNLLAWAGANGVPVIDLYAYVSGNRQIDPADGIHYLPRPDPGMWSYILSCL